MDPITGTNIVLQSQINSSFDLSWRVIPVEHKNRYEILGTFRLALGMAKARKQKIHALRPVSYTHLTLPTTPYV